VAAFDMSPLPFDCLYNMRRLFCSRLFYGGKAAGFGTAADLDGSLSHFCSFRGKAVVNVGSELPT
jgi:hypothetical protein